MKAADSIDPSTMSVELRNRLASALVTNAP